MVAFAHVYFVFLPFISTLVGLGIVCGTGTLCLVNYSVVVCVFGLTKLRFIRFFVEVGPAEIIQNASDFNLAMRLCLRDDCIRSLIYLRTLHE